MFFYRAPAKAAATNREPNGKTISGRLSHFFGDGEKFFGVASHGDREVAGGGGDADAAEGGVVAYHVVFGEPGDALPGDGVALAGAELGGAPDGLQPHAEAPVPGEVYEDVERAGHALAVAGEVAGPGLLHAPAPGGVVAQLDEGGVVGVPFVELQRVLVGLPFDETIDEHGGGGALFRGAGDEGEGARVVFAGQLLRQDVPGQHGVLDRAQEHDGRDAQGVVAVDVVVHHVAGEDEGLQVADPRLVDREDGPVVLPDDAQGADQSLDVHRAVGDFGPARVAHQGVERGDVQGAREQVPGEVLRRRQVV